MQEIFEKTITYLKKFRDILLILYPLSITISGFWLFLYSILIAKLILPLPPELLSYLFLFIPTTIGLIPIFVTLLLMHAKQLLRKLFDNTMKVPEKILIPYNITKTSEKILLSHRIEKRATIATTVSILLGIFIILTVITPALIKVEDLPESVSKIFKIIRLFSPYLTILIPILFTVTTGISLLKHANKKLCPSTLFQLIWISLIIVIALLLPSFISMLFLTKSAVHEIHNKTAWLYVIILIITYTIPFSSPLILYKLAQETNRNNSQGKMTNLVRILIILILILAIPTIKWIVITPLSIAKLGYFEAKIVDKGKTKNILVIWNTGNTILYRDIANDNKKYTIATDIKEIKLTSDKEIIIYNKPILSLPPP